LLYSLNKAGLKNLIGIDLYIKREIINNDIKVYKKSIYDLPNNQKFDLIMFNHSFEHIYEQLQTISKVYNLLSEGGACLIRMPIKTDYIWNQYGIHWVQIDAPRHFFVHTPKSFELLVEKSDLFTKEIVYDSTEFQFWGSEQYKENISLNEKDSYLIKPDKSIFKDEQIQEYRKMAKELNKNGQGDQVAFILKKSR